MSKKKKNTAETAVETPEAPEAVEAAAPIEEVEAPLEVAPEPVEGDVAPEAISEVAGTEISPASESTGDPAEELVDEPVSATPLDLVIEAILFASQKPMSAKELIAVLKGAADAGKEDPASVARPFAKVKDPQIRSAIEQIELKCANGTNAYEVRESAAGWQLVTKPNFAPWLRQLFPENRSARLSAPAMETLAIIAYRQPITRADIEAVRGVAVDGVMQTLLDRGLLKIAGRAEIPGRPLLYETTQFFMEHFGLKDLDDLPNAAELRKISLPTAAPPAEEPPAPAAGQSAVEETAVPETGPVPEAATALESSEAPETSPVEVAPEAPPEEPVTSPESHHQ